MACKNLAIIIISLFLLVSALAAPAEKPEAAELANAESQKEDLAAEDLKPAASHWGGHYGGWGGWGGHYGGYYPYYGSYYGWPSYGFGGYGGYGGYGYWPYGGYYGHHGGYWW